MESVGGKEGKVLLVKLLAVKVIRLRPNFQFFVVNLRKIPSEIYNTIYKNTLIYIRLFL